MKRFFAIILMATMLSASALPSFAQGRRSRSRVTTARTYYNYRYDNRSFWEKHRDKLTVAAGAGGGALLGSLLGGKKGALIGTLTGGGGSALYTYKLRNRYNYRRY